MEHFQTLNQRYETIAWGAIFVLIGLLGLLPGTPPGAGTFGIGVILLGLNGARWIRQIPVNRFTLTLGLVAVVLGGAVWLGSLRGYVLDGPLFPALLIALGIYWMLPGRDKKSSGDTA